MTLERRILMSDTMIAQVETEVKQCELDWCHEPVFREGLCWYHFLEEVVDEWDAEEPEGVDFIFGDATLSDSWWGYDPKEVLA
jgi:hypothetical protein